MEHAGSGLGHDNRATHCHNAGVGTGIHPWEDYPPVTMRAIEYIFAAELHQSITSDSGNATDAYTKTLKSNGIESNSWYCVRVDMTKLKRLSVLASCGTLSLHATSLRELIRNRYIGGLAKIGEYKAWTRCLSIFDSHFISRYSVDSLVQKTGI